MGDAADQDEEEASSADSWAEQAAPVDAPDLRDLPERVFARVARGDSKGRSFGTPRNPRLPTFEEFNPRIAEVRAGDLDSLVIRRRHGLFPEQVESIGHLGDEELVRFRPEDPISAVEASSGLSLTGGHHRTAEIINRVRSGRLPANTIIRILVHD
jgi:hypothetical protein